MPEPDAGFVVKLTVDVPRMTTLIEAVLLPRMFEAFNVTTRVQDATGQVNVWMSGSCAVDVVPSAKSQDHALGEPPDVSRNSTSADGPTTVTVLGASVPFAVNAAVGALPYTGPPPPAATLLSPDLTGKSAEADTATEPPRIAEIPGVMTVKVHESRTCTESPRVVELPSALRSSKVGAGTTLVPPDCGSRQFVAAASARIWFL